MVRIQRQRFDAGALADELRRATSGRAGAIVHFLGLVRDYGADARSVSLYLEHYPGMCERQIQQLCDAARSRWNILDALVVHRVGELPLADPIVFVGVASAHRHDAFRACEYLIDALKTRAPFWKREILANGQRPWVEQRDSDTRKTAQWDVLPSTSQLEN